MNPAALLVAALLATATVAHPALVTMPEHLRGGELYARMQRVEAASLAQLGATPNRSVNWFEQLIDHQNPATGTFRQRYYYDVSHYNAQRGLVFLYIAGEGPVSSSLTGYGLDVAYEMGAAVVTLEHRWYGESVPRPYTIANQMATLTLEQALADFVHFLPHFEQTVTGQKNTWVAVGGSYSGALVAWLKQKYPTTFVASWSSSGVVNAIFNYWQYDGHIASVMGEDCSDAVRRTFQAASDQWDFGTLAQRKALIKLFDAGANATKTDVYSSMVDVYATSVQYSTRTTFCARILPFDSKDPLSKFARAGLDAFGPRAFSPRRIRLADSVAELRAAADAAADAAVRSAQGGSAMSRVHSGRLSLPKRATGSLAEIRQAAWTAAYHNTEISPQALTSFSWTWQCCSTFGWWQIGFPGGLSPTNVSTDYNVDICRTHFGVPTLMSNTYAFNKQYNGYYPEADNVVALVGSDDPWGPVQVQQSLRPTYPRFLAECANCGHCGDLQGVVSGEPPQKTAQRQFIRTKLREWVGY